VALSVQKREAEEKMNTPELREAMNALTGQPRMLIDAKFDKEEVTVTLKPEIFAKLLKTVKLLSAGSKDKNLKRLEKRKKLDFGHQSEVKFKDMRNAISTAKGFRAGEAAIVGLKRLYFFPLKMDKDTHFSLKGCTYENVTTDQNNVYISNQKNQKCVIQLPSA